MNMRINSAYAPIVLRFGLAFVFLWFGFSQLTDQAAWTGFVPDWITMFGITKTTFVVLNGFGEIFAGTLLVLGVFTQWVALLLALHLLAIVFDLGLDALGVRDTGLTMACFTLFLMEPDAWQLMPKWPKKTAPVPAA
jgi:uncharacterized membrane protein YphA (DoxX/SURF4 family)